MRTFIFISSIIGLLFSLSCSKDKKVSDISKKQIIVTDTALVNGVLLELIDDNGKSLLKVNSKKYHLSGNMIAKPPCHFLRRNGKVLSFSYPDIQIEQTIIVQGRGGIQGILFKKDSLIYEDYLTTSSPYNIKEGADEVVYWDFAHRTHKNK